MLRLQLSKNRLQRQKTDAETALTTAGQSSHKQRTWNRLWRKKRNGGRDCACPLPSACPAGNPFIIQYVWTKSRVFIKEICSDPSIFSSSWKQAVKLLQRASLSTFNSPSIKLKTQLGLCTGEQAWSQIMKPKPKKTNRLNKTVTSWLDWEVLVKHKHKQTEWQKHRRTGRGHRKRG